MVLIFGLASCGGDRVAAPGHPEDSTFDTATIELPHNVLLIIADDLGVDMMQFYQPELPGLPPTPNLDSLAASGVRFDNAWSAPNCSPTRAMLLTGRFGFRTGVGQAYKVEEDAVLSYDELALPEVLSSAGYGTSAIGKWHLGSQVRDYEDSPRLHGFDWYSGSIFNFTEVALDGSPTSYFDWEKTTNGVVGRSTTYATTDTTNEAVARMASMPEPWMIWVAYNAPHLPVHVPPDALHTQDVPANPTDRGKFKMMIEAMDTEVGRLLGAMTPEQAERTTVIFLGDNGTPGPVVEVVDPAQAKGTMYQAALHVPFIVAGADVTSPGISSALVSAVDVYATIAEIAGADSLAEDSLSLLPLLDDLEATVRDTLYADKFRPNGLGPYVAYSRALRDDRYKVIDVQDADGVSLLEFYDLQADPWEQSDLLAAGLTPVEQTAYDALRQRLNGDYPSPLSP